MTTPTLNLDGKKARPPSCTFTLAGRVWSCRNADDVPFDLARRIFTAQLGGKVSEFYQQLGPFLQAMIAEKDWPDFEALMNQPGSPITTGVVGDLVPFMVSQVIGLPTAPSKPSRTGRQTTGSKSRAASSSRATRRKAS